MLIEINGEEKMKTFGESIGLLLKGGEIIELIGDVGAGKTTLVKGIAVGLDIDEHVQSPSFTISRVYQGRDNLTLNHFDFYRLDSAGIMADEIQEVISDPTAITIIEWGGVVNGVLPADRLSIRIVSPTEDSRSLELLSGGVVSQKIVEKLSL